MVQSIQEPFPWNMTSLWFDGMCRGFPGFPARDSNGRPTKTTCQTLAVEVDFDTDPDSPNYHQQVLDAIEMTVKDVLANETTTVGSLRRIVPKAKG